MTTLQDELAPYTDAFGLIAPRKCKPTDAPASGNGVLYTSEAILLSRPDIMFSPYQWYLSIDRCFIIPGLLKRAPENQTDQVGPDDYIGLAVAWWSVGHFGYPRDWLKYGWKHFGFYNNELPGTYRHRDGRINWSAFLWRQPQLIAHFMWAGRMAPPLPLRLYWAVTIALSGWRKPLTDTDARILPWLMIQVADRRYWSVKVASRIFEKRLRKDYPRGMKDVAELYFEPSHPLAKYWPEF